MLSLGRCQEQLRRLRNSKPAPGETSPPPARPGSPFRRWTPSPWEGRCAVAQGPNRVPSWLPGIHHPTHPVPWKAE